MFSALCHCNLVLSVEEGRVCVCACVGEGVRGGWGGGGG